MLSGDHNTSTLAQLTHSERASSLYAVHLLCSCQPRVDKFHQDHSIGYQYRADHETFGNVLSKLEENLRLSGRTPHQNHYQCGVNITCIRGLSKIIIFIYLN